MSTGMITHNCSWVELGIKCPKRGHITKLFKDKGGREHYKYYCAEHDKLYYDRFEDPYKDIRKVKDLLTDYKPPTRKRYLNGTGAAFDKSCNESTQSNWRERQRNERKNEHGGLPRAYEAYDQICEETQRKR